MKTLRLNLIALLFLAGHTFTQAQDTSPEYRNFPIVVSLQFQALALPFKDLKANFANIGLGLGTEVSLNGKDNWAQQVNLIWYRNRSTGNGLGLYTQCSWRPTIGSGFFTEVKGGLGYIISFRPVESYQQVGGSWVSAGKKGNGMLAIPVGIGAGYHSNSSDVQVSPFATYQFFLMSGYSKSIPIVPVTIMQVGTRIHP
jgi:hypothetical protein